VRCDGLARYIPDCSIRYAYTSSFRTADRRFDPLNLINNKFRDPRYNYL
jgi:hypothetical protein